MTGNDSEKKERTVSNKYNSNQVFFKNDKDKLWFELEKCEIMSLWIFNSTQLLKFLIVGKYQRYHAKIDCRVIYS